MKQKLTVGTLTLLSNHPVLNQVARDLASTVTPESLPARKITVYLGVHRRFGWQWFRRGVKIAIQTEHFFDADGHKMWRSMKRWRACVAALLCDRVLELSAFNKPYYAFMPLFLQKRITFGPHIFPSHQPRFQPGNQSAFLFFGEMNERRKMRIAELPPQSVELAPPATFGADLEALIAQAAGVLNLHYVDGRYSEMPRLLASCLAGKAVMSDPLGDELVSGRDYFALGPAPSQEEARKIYDGFWHNFAAHHGFCRFLHNVVKGVK